MPLDAEITLVTSATMLVGPAPVPYLLTLVRESAARVRQGQALAILRRCRERSVKARWIRDTLASNARHARIARILVEQAAIDFGART